MAPQDIRLVVSTLDRRLRVPHAFAARLWMGGIALAAVLVAACSRPQPGAPDAHATSAAGGAPEASAVATQPIAARPRVVFLGDSLTAGLGVSPAEAYPAVVQRRIDEAGLAYEVVNAGVSGDTSAGGLRRVDWSLQGDVRVLVVALGGNDGLRGLPASELRQNLASIIEAAEKRHVDVLLAGMEAPPNFGEVYTRDFRDVYRDLARTEHVRLVPFFLDGVAGQAALNQPDGIHPNAQGHRLVADRMWRALEPMLRKRQTS